MVAVNDDLSKAAQDAVDASDNTRQVELIAAVLKAQQLLNGQPSHHQCEHTPQQQFDAKKWWTITGMACIGGCVACALALAFAIAAIAVAIGATCATGCFVILRSIWREHQKGR